MLLKDTIDTSQYVVIRRRIPLEKLPIAYSQANFSNARLIDQDVSASTEAEAEAEVYRILHEAITVTRVCLNEANDDCLDSNEIY